jgi:cyclic pyranopterin monophosphate synthase
MRTCFIPPSLNMFLPTILYHQTNNQTTHRKTSDLIPLCHPLPLDRVHIDIRMPTNDTILITCECRVTHKTGVEMEVGYCCWSFQNPTLSCLNLFGNTTGLQALTGATVAALTVYDMLKALSHNIRIEQTVLVSKSGGKRTVGPVPNAKDS